MSSTTVSEFIIIIAVLLIGLVAFTFTQALVVPQYAFNSALQLAKSLASTIYIDLSPPESSSNGYVFLSYIYSPSYSGNFSVIVFTVPVSELPSVSGLTPTQLSQYSITLPNDNGKPAKLVTLPAVYDLNGRQLTGSIQAYSIPSNTTFQITINVQQNYAVVLWVIYNSGGYYFRIGYTYEG
ncbi:hypothetical protein BFU36_11440 [Sulfolobus sp. A20]|uniref:hypothetical protein n=1 Tax=Saccharolobus sp. A20 TaxID=1891280 RepID=UPI000845E475|nr:hypothetical protein [Sulfolobus sp. A20]TRM74227.1 hypothetical protein DJ528_10605 [Sulfolobus sp. B5]TRM81672.1 hypothetical protein DJ524_03270 [Sulfolobus sp. D5]TRM84100.1 hypothetical protein DJ531_02280 [Sulfolobus sp. A20-N-F6]TRN04820.1 hypothetical protein DJ530_00315 [Sulfolobus sp. E1]AOL17218.1 hypothetical protein BFU36_11440 [Sulfolobus sp. A20]